MTRKTPDFALHHCGSWGQGQVVNITTTIQIVEYDQHSHAYVVAKMDQDDFEEWVADKFEIETNQRRDGEEASEYLDRVGISVSEYGA